LELCQQLQQQLVDLKYCLFTNGIARRLARAWRGLPRHRGRVKTFGSPEPINGRQNIEQTTQNGCKANVNVRNSTARFVCQRERVVLGRKVVSTSPVICPPPIFTPPGYFFSAQKPLSTNDASVINTYRSASTGVSKYISKKLMRMGFVWQQDTTLREVTRCSAIAARPRCRMCYSFRQK